MFKFKAALVNICISIMDQMTMCNVKGSARSVKPTENYYWLSLPSALLSVYTSFSSLFWFPTAALINLVSSSSSSSRQLCPVKKLWKPTAHNRPSTKQQTEKLNTQTLFSSWKARYFPEELVEKKTELEGVWVLKLPLLDSQKHNSK